MIDKLEGGMDVHVFSDDMKKDFGMGIIEKIEHIQIKDSCKVAEGISCWGISIDREGVK